MFFQMIILYSHLTTVSMTIQIFIKDSAVQTYCKEPAVKIFSIGLLFKMQFWVLYTNKDTSIINACIQLNVNLYVHFYKYIYMYYIHHSHMHSSVGLLASCFLLIASWRTHARIPYNTIIPSNFLSTINHMPILYILVWPHLNLLCMRTTYLMVVAYIDPAYCLLYNILSLVKAVYTQGGSTWCQGQLTSFIRIFFRISIVMYI
jgi:hypothetical protein